MKKVCLAKKGAEDIKFLLRGQRHGADANELEITHAGVVVSNEDAEVLEDRLGMQISVTDVDAKDVAKEAEAAAKAAAGANTNPAEPSDAVKTLAEKEGIDLATVTGTGANGTIIKKDVDAAIKAKADEAAKKE